MKGGLTSSLVLFYSASLPYHPGKWRVVNALIRATRVDAHSRGTTHVVRRRGLRWKLSTDCWVQRTLFFHADWDTYELHHLLSRFPKDGVFFDIGSYFGYYALVLAKHAGPRSTAYAFEPLRQNFDLLAENVRLNEITNVIPNRLALSDSEGEAVMALPEQSNQGSGHISVETASKKGHETVPVTTLDSFVADRAVERIDFIKLDVEGAEVEVLRGGAKTIERTRPGLLVELNETALKRRGSSGVELVETISHLGYDCFAIEKRKLRPFSVAEVSRDPELATGYINLLCLPKGKGGRPAL